MTRLLIIGGGPKALSLAVKAFILKKHSNLIPHVIVIDKYSIGANWDGTNGFTDGKHGLGTPPEKDIFFPYKSISEITNIHSDINMDAFKYSWPSFLVDEGEYLEWIDRGKPTPSHTKWARYFNWLKQKTNFDFIQGNVEKISLSNDKWILKYTNNFSDDNSEKSIEGESLVITGPGEPIRLGAEPNENFNYKNGQNFWKSLDFLKTLLDKARSKQVRVGVIGGGETSASVVTALIEFFTNQGVNDNILIDIINRKATVYSRGENYHENKFFTNPDGWKDLSYELREEFINRTDRGVFSLQTLSVINNCEFVRHVYGEVESVSDLNPKLRVRLKNYQPIDYDCVINALGFDSFGFFRIMDEKFFKKIKLKLDDVMDKKELIKKEIGHHLDLKILHSPKLFLPTLSAIEQGPGFPNLSSLGLLSDRILSYFLKNKIS